MLNEKQENHTKTSESTTTFPYPSFWNDTAKMKILLADFHKRELNPGSYDSKIKFWEEMIEQYCVYYGKVVFCKQELQVQFAQDDRIPACLDSVLRQMQQMQKLRLRTEYEYDPENSWSGWVIHSFLRRPLFWGWGKVRNALLSGDTKKESHIQWVHLEVIKSACSKLEKYFFSEHRGKLLSFDIVKSMSADCLKICEESLLIILYSLYSQHKIGLDYELTDEKILRIFFVKIPRATGDNNAITESDRALHSLLLTQANLLKQIKDIECDIKSNEEKALELVSLNKRHLAKTYLRKKKLLESIYEKRSNALHNIDLLLANVDEAQQNGFIIEAYKIGSKALQNALNNCALKYDNMDEVIADVRETIDQAREVQDTISNTNLVDSMQSMTDDDIEHELNELMGMSNKAIVSENSPNTEETIAYNIDSKHVKTTDQELSKMLDRLNVEDGTFSNKSTSSTQLSAFK